MIAAAAQGKNILGTRKKGISPNYIFPHELVERGDGARPVKRGEATREEYTLALKLMETHPLFPERDLKALSAHQALLAHDNCKAPWHIVRRYSEEIFSRIADGRLPYGWHDKAALAAVRIDAIAMANLQPDDPPPTTSSKPISRFHQDPKNPYDKADMGIPCVVWNRDPEACSKVGKGESHGTHPQKYIHICGFCAYVRRIVANHPESKCISKKSRGKQADLSNRVF